MGSYYFQAGSFRGELPLIHNGNSEVSAHRHSMRKLLELKPRFRKERVPKGK